MNDSLRSDVFLRYAPETIACACIHLASLSLGIPLPRASKILSESTPDGATLQEGCDWWQLFAPADSSVVNVSRLLLKLYTRKRRVFFFFVLCNIHIRFIHILNFKPKWERLDAEVNKLKQLILEKQAANKITGGIENTPNPHSTQNLLKPAAPDIQSMQN